MELFNASKTQPQPQVVEAQAMTWRLMTFETVHPQLRLAELHPNLPNLVDVASPRSWAPERKRLILTLSCLATVFTAYTAGAFAPAASMLSKEWHRSEEMILLGITAFTTGFSITPMIVAPISEVHGRQPVLVISGLLFLTFQVLCSRAKHYIGMMLLRFAVGCASSTFIVVIGGVFADIFSREDRQWALTLLTSATLFGTGLGPMSSGIIVAHLNWRWTFYVQIIVDAILVLSIILFFKETRASVLLAHKACAFNRYSAEVEAAGYSDNMRVRWRCPDDGNDGELKTSAIAVTVRPFRMLFTEPVVFCFSLWVSFCWMVLYMTFTAIPLIFETRYGFSREESAGVFGLIAIVAMIFPMYSAQQYSLLTRLSARIAAKIIRSPERALCDVCLEGWLFPLGCICFAVLGAYGWCPWPLAMLGIVFVTMGIFSICLAVFNYLSIVYEDTSSSALAAQNFCRNLIGGICPIFTVKMFVSLGFQGAGCLLGAVGLCLCAIPWLLLLFGPRIRARSRLAGQSTHVMSDA